MTLTRSRSFVVGAIILAVGMGGLVLLILLRPEPPREERPELSPLVNTVEAVRKSDAVFVRGTGTVRATQEIVLVAEASGKVLYKSPSFVSGGSFTRGETLLRIDPADYENAVTVADAEVTQRRFELLRAREEADVAREEWSRLQAESEVEASADSTLGSLVLREPQLRLAEAALKAAEARLADARNRLERTIIVAPFNGRVRSESADVGQFVGPGQQLGVVYATDQVEIAVPLPTADAALIGDLWSNARNGRIAARVLAEFGGMQHAWSASVHRTEGAIDAATRTINVVVRVDNPYNSRDSRPPLLVGTFAEIEIEAGSTGDHVAIPRSALRDGDVVWAVAEGRLRVLPVQVLTEIEDTVLIREGLVGGEEIVISPLAIMTDGMSVRLSE